MKHGLIPGSLHAYGESRKNIEPGGILHELATATGKTLLFYWAFGERSAMAVQAAQDLGMSAARHIEGGMNAWLAAGGEFEHARSED